MVQISQNIIDKLKDRIDDIDKLKLLLNEKFSKEDLESKLQELEFTEYEIKQILNYAINLNMISNSGRVVIIDDVYEEASPLMELFGKYSIPYLYYNGSMVNLPLMPLNGIRFVFLDIVIEGMNGQSAKTTASPIANILSTIISPDNGPYVIIFWTKHNDIIKEVINYCEEKLIQPLAHIETEKNEWLNYDINELSEKLKEKLTDIKAFQLYIEWENIVNESSKQLIKSFSSLVPYDNTWSEKISSLFYHLYEAYVEENIIDSNEDKFKTACYLMNRSYKDVLDSNITKHLTLPEGFRIDGLVITTEVKAKLNTALFLIEHRLPQILPGCVTKISNEENFLNALKNSFQINSNNEDIIFCKIMITPSCDIAQNKLLKVNSSSVLHRVVYGLLYKPEYSFKIRDIESTSLSSSDKHNLLSGNPYKEQDLIKKIKELGISEQDTNVIFKNVKIKPINFEKDTRNSIFMIGPIYFQHKIYNLTFNFLTLTAEEFSPQDEDILFNLQTDLLFDLQSKAANHLNRIGNFMFKVKI